MPSQTFLNLSPEKQDRLVKAGIMEFSQRPKSQASVSNIIRSAEIPRGSFYQYFEDLDEFFSYLFQQVLLELDQFTSDVTLDLDLKSALINHGSQYIEFMLTSHYSQFLRQVLLHADFQLVKRIYQASRWVHQSNNLDQEKLLTYFEKYLVIEQKDIGNFIEFYHFVLTHCITKALVNHWTLDDCQELFEQRLQWLLEGTLRREKLND